MLVGYDWLLSGRLKRNKIHTEKELISPGASLRFFVRQQFQAFACS